LKVLISGWGLEIVQPTIGEHKEIGTKNKRNKAITRKWEPTQD
jgi:hypothetical protein